MGTSDLSMCLNNDERCAVALLVRSNEGFHWLDSPGTHTREQNALDV